MSFADLENSNDQGRPIFLYAFALGSATWRYTSGDKDVVLNGYKWTRAAISDDGVKITGDSTTDALSITAPSRIAPVQMFFTTPPSQSITVSIYHYHEGDTEAVMGYFGEMLEVTQPEPGKAQITVDTISASMQRDGLRLAWQRGCGYAVYDELTCKANKAAHVLNLTVYEITSNQVQMIGLDSTANGHLNGGYLEWEDPIRGTEFRAIEQQVGNVCTMFGLADGLYYGLAVKAYPGCMRTAAECKTKFNNYDNYPGVPDMPGKSPFDGDPVF